MTSSPDKSISLPWSQPLGLWRARGAGSSALRLGMGLPPLHQENVRQPEIDKAGYGLWHYWAESPRPHDLWSSAKAKLSADIRNHRSNEGEHAWHRLALRGHLDAMQSWVKSFELPFGEDFDHIGIGQHSDTLFMRAVWSGNDKLVQWLMDLGAEMHSPDDQGHTPLMVAIHRCSADMVHQLLKNGADPEAKDSKGRTAMHHAAQSEQPDLYTLVEDCGGDASTPDLHCQTAKSILERALRTPQQAFITQGHWDLRYHSKLSF